MDSGLIGSIAALVWVLHRHGTVAILSVPRRSGLRELRRSVLAATRAGVAALGAAVFMVAVASIAGAALPDRDGPILYLCGVGCSLAVMLGIETAVFRLRRALALEAVRDAARRKRPRSVQTMMRLGLGPRSEQLP
ncbi:MAG: hypothetical protein IT515_11200 [Burkholderiales bacterium]|nr:hypothetical protein [Burkholderiales bacterium]